MIERQNVGRAVLAYRRYQGNQIVSGGVGGKLPVPQRHVEGGVLATHETSDAKAKSLFERERQQQQRPTFGVIGDDNEGPETLTFTDLQLPGAQEIEPLIRRGELLLIFQTAPDRFCLAEIGENIHASDAARP